MIFNVTGHLTNTKISQLFGSVAEKRGFTQITLFRSKCSKMGLKLIGTIKNTKMIFDYITKKKCPLGKNIGTGQKCTQIIIFSHS